MQDIEGGGRTYYVSKLPSLWWIEDAVRGLGGRREPGQVLPGCPGQEGGA